MSFEKLGRFFTWLTLTAVASVAAAEPLAVVGVTRPNGFPTPPPTIVQPAVLDLATTAPTLAAQSIPMCTPNCALSGFGPYPNSGRIAADRDGNHVYMAMRTDNPFDGGVVTLDVRSLAYGTRVVIADLTSPRIAFHPYKPILVLVGGSTLTRRAVFLNADDLSTMATVPLPDPVDDTIVSVPTFSADGAFVFVSAGLSLYKLDANGGGVVAVARLGFPFSLRMDTARPWLWIIDFENSRVVALDANTLEQVASFSRDGVLRDLAVNPDGNLWLLWEPALYQRRWIELVDKDGELIGREDDPYRGDFLRGGPSKWLYRLGDPSNSSLLELDSRMYRLRQQRNLSPWGPLELGAWLNYIAFLPEPAVAIEYYHAALDHYFLTADADEIDGLDRGEFAGWQRTGETLKVMRSDAGTSGADIPVCRFYGLPTHGLDSHFYTSSRSECDAVEHGYDGAWLKERADAFYVVRVDEETGVCPDSTVPVYRLWNARVDSNHRYTKSAAMKADMVARGYIPEGSGPDAVAFCVRD